MKVLFEMKKDPTVRTKTKWRLSPEEDFDWLVDSESGDRVRVMRLCETLTESGSLRCGSLSSVRLLFEPFMAAIALVSATARTFEVRLSVACPVCKAQTSWSIPFASWLGVLSLLRSVESNLVDHISITWQMTLRPCDTATNSAFGAWRLAATPVTTTVLAPSDSGG